MRAKGAQLATKTGSERAVYAADPDRSRGRRIAEQPSPTRNDFRRDCDRIIHSTAFRRLAHKTQVFVYHEGDHYRTRLTHTLEVAQIARSLARALGLDEDLAEALALAHDLGHPPFGHAGERALDAALSQFGGFDHNAQALRIVTDLERRYAAYDGLNLTWETLEGLVKHNGPLIDRNGSAVAHYSERGVPEAILAYNKIQKLDLWTQPSPEAQVAALSDDIAYDAQAVVDIVRVIGNIVGQSRHLGFRTGLRPQIQLLNFVVGQNRLRHAAFAVMRDGTAVAIDERAVVLDQTFERFPGEVETVIGRVAALQIGDDAQRLSIVVEAAEPAQGCVECALAGVTERRMTEIVRQRQGLGQVLVEPERARQRTGYLYDLKCVGQSGAVMIALVIDEHLRLVREAAECG